MLVSVPRPMQDNPGCIRACRCHERKLAPSIGMESVCSAQRMWQQQQQQQRINMGLGVMQCDAQALIW